MDKTAPTSADNEKPKGFWNTALTMIPVVLALVATGFAGISSSEMTQSMYYRSLAAQHQSKAGDQWGFFQAKRLRGTSLEMTVDVLQNLGQPDSFDPAQFDRVFEESFEKIDRLQLEKQDKTASVPKSGSGKEDLGKAKEKVKAIQARLQKLFSDEKTKQSLNYLTTSTLPKSEEKKLSKPDVQKTIDEIVNDISQRKTEAETAKSIRALSPADIDEAILVTEQNADSFEKACEPIMETIREFRAILKELSGAVKTGALETLNKSFKAAELDFNARRYRHESVYNRKAAEVYEIRVRRSGVESDHHRERSKMFFYAMLIGQVGVMISSLAIGRSLRGLLLCAVSFGLASVGFGGYVFFAI